MNESPLIPVPVGACRCPDAPHPDGDVVYLFPKLGLEGGIAVQSALAIGDTPTAKLHGMYVALIEHGVADWTITNGTGEKLAINPASIRAALPWMEGGSAVANAAFEQYGEVVTGPLAARKPATISRRTGKSSRRGRTSATSTSANPAT